MTRGQVFVPTGRAVADQAHDLVVDLGIERREREVLELPLDGVHAQPVRQRGIDFQRLARLVLLLGDGQEPPGTRVVQPVGELDDEHPDVARHRHDHLADGLGLRGLAVLHLVELGHPVDEGRDLLTEVGPHLLEGVGGVLDGVVQQRRAQRHRRHAELGEDRGHREGMGDVGVAALAPLPAVVQLGLFVRPLDDLEVGLGMGAPDGAEQRFEHRIGERALGAQARQAGADPPPGGGALVGRRGSMAASSRTVAGGSVRRPDARSRAA